MNDATTEQININNRRRDANKNCKTNIIYGVVIAGFIIVLAISAFAFIYTLRRSQIKRPCPAKITNYDIFNGTGTYIETTIGHNNKGEQTYSYKYNLLFCPKNKNPCEKAIGIVYLDTLYNDTSIFTILYKQCQFDNELYSCKEGLCLYVNYWHTYYTKPELHAIGIIFLFCGPLAYIMGVLLIYCLVKSYR